MDELLAIAFKHPPDFAPRERFEYSNTNTVLLGTVIDNRHHHDDRLTLGSSPGHSSWRRRLTASAFMPPY